MGWPDKQTIFFDLIIDEGGNSGGAKYVELIDITLCISKCIIYVMKVNDVIWIIVSLFERLSICNSLWENVVFC